MLNSYKTLINGIATAIDTLKAEVKNKFAAVDSKISAVSAAVTDGLAAMPVEDDLTIVRDSDGKLSTSLGAYERSFKIDWDSDTTGLPSFSLKYTEGNYTLAIPYYKVSDTVMTVDDFENENTSVSVVLSSSNYDDYDDFKYNKGFIHTLETGDGFIALKIGIFLSQAVPAVVAATEDGATYTGVFVPKKGVYFPRLSVDDRLYGTKALTVKRLKKIDEKFIPARTGELIVVKVSGSGTSADPYTADKTYDYVKSAYEGGADIIAVWGNGEITGHATSAKSYGIEFSAIEAYATIGSPYITIYAASFSSSENWFFTEKRVPTRGAMYEELNGLKTNFILNSSTEGSSKQFKITVDDEGTISATEVTTS